MIVIGVDKNNMTMAMDMVQLKYLVSILREVTEEQLVLAAKEVFDAGFDDGDPVSALAAAKSFTNVFGFYTDKAENVAPHKQQSTTVEELGEVIDLSTPQKLVN